MRALDDLDRRMLALLRADGRMPVAAMAQTLHVSRATAQTRLTRLVNDRVIRRFTIEVGAHSEETLVRAITLLQVKGNAAPAIARRLGTMPAVRAMHTTNGEWDMVVEITAASLADLDEVLAELRRMDAVAHSETSILLTTL